MVLSSFSKALLDDSVGKERSVPMKIAVVLLAFGLLQACGSLPTGKKMDQGGQYMQFSLSGTILVQVDFPTARACSDDLRASPIYQADLTCSLASAASTLRYKGSLNRLMLGEKYPLHFKTDDGCLLYRKDADKSQGIALSCN